MKKKHNFIKYIAFRGMIISIIFAIVIIMIDIIYTYHQFNVKEKQIRIDYIAEKKTMIKLEIERAVDYINFEKNYQHNVNDAKSHILNHLSSIRFGVNNDLFIFIVSYDGTVILVDDTQRKIVGKNLYNLSKNAAKLAKMERDAVENPNGDFIDYKWHKPSTGKMTPKTSFIKGIKDWKWMVGTGVYLDDVEKTIIARKIVLKEDILEKIKWFALTIVLVILVLYLLLNRLNLKIQADLNQVVSSFNKAASSDEEINTDIILFSEIHNMAENVNKMLREKEKTQQELAQVAKLKSIGVLAGGIAHDFNNILSAILGNIQLAKMTIDQDHKAISILGDSEKAVRRASSLTKQLLTFSKGGVPITTSMNIKELIESVAKFNLNGSHLQLISYFQEGLWKCDIDEGQISQVIANLIINAKDSMTNAGNIYINVENFNNTTIDKSLILNEKYVKIIIRDEGKGISGTDIKKIFDPYFTTKKNGSGLGLAIVHSVIKKHKGHIEIESTKGTGSSFIIYLPVGEKIEEKNKQIDTREYKSSNETLNILIMDDEEMIRLSLSSLLEFMGYNADTVPDGEEAVKKYTQAMKSENKYDLVFMDLTIPGYMGGKDAIKKVLEIDKDANVIVMSGYSDDTVMANYLDYGFKGRLNKPLSKENIEKEIKKVLS